MTEAPAGTPDLDMEKSFTLGFTADLVKSS